MLRGKVPSLIGGSNGKPTITIALRKCECSRCHIEILKDEKCADIPKLRSSFASTKRFCIKCLNDIINKTKEDIQELQKSLK
jgi:hypothetical protein